MNDSFEQRIRRLMSGDARGGGATLARGALAVAEPLYAGVAGTRNALFDRRWLRVRRLPRPVISVGNLTTGGTGKTPVVQWLARELTAAGRRPAVLLRGYRRADPSTASDEERLLRDSLGCVVVADPDRHRGGSAALAREPAIDVFVLDDGFQHRRLHRDRDVVLVDATNPFGYAHVLPRGMLREPLAGLARADLVVLTRTDLVDPATLADIESAVGRHNAKAPIVRTRHAPADVIGEGGGGGEIASLRGRAMAFCGIGNPDAFLQMLRRATVDVVASRAFADHHLYTTRDLAALRAAAVEARADVLVTTEKDWVKLAPLTAGEAPVKRRPPIVRVAIRLGLDDAARATTLNLLTSLFSIAEKTIN